MIFAKVPRRLDSRSTSTSPTSSGSCVNALTSSVCEARRRREEGRGRMEKDIARRFSIFPFPFSIQAEVFQRPGRPELGHRESRISYGVQTTEVMADTPAPAAVSDPVVHLDAVSVIYGKNQALKDVSAKFA